MDYFNPIQALIEGTGALINSSKKRFTWRFELDSSEHSVELECSFITNKRRVTFDGRLIYKGSKPLGRDFQYRFNHEKHILTVENHRTDANLLVDSLSFDEIYSKRIWNRTFGSKNAENQEKVVDPRPARYISEEEYTKSSSLADKNVEKPSLHDLLHKDNSKNAIRAKISNDFLELEDKNQDLLGFEEKKSENLIEFSENLIGKDPILAIKGMDYNEKVDIFDTTEKNQQNKPIGIDLLGEFSVDNKKVESSIGLDLFSNTKSLNSAFQPISAE